MFVVCWFMCLSVLSVCLIAICFIVSALLADLLLLFDRLFLSNCFV